MKKSVVSIEETEHVIDDRFFDVLGNEFKNHVKGLAEWLKNSADAYIRKMIPANEQFVVLRFTDNNSIPTIECIDFIGMSHKNIQEAVRRWGDPTAAKSGKNIKTYGGHGNGGKFYMRQAFSESHIITYKDGDLNIWGFSKNGRYGFGTGFENKAMTPSEAMRIAKIDKLLISRDVKDKIIKGETGISTVVGIDPVGTRKALKPHKEVEKLKDFPQS